MLWNWRLRMNSERLRQAHDATYLAGRRWIARRSHPGMNVCVCAMCLQHFFFAVPEMIIKDEANTQT